MDLGFELALVREERLQASCHARCANDLPRSAAARTSCAPDQGAPLSD
jgi:hypothetical protein